MHNSCTYVFLLKKKSTTEYKFVLSLYLSFPLVIVAFKKITKFH